MVKYLFNALSNDISHVAVASNFCKLYMFKFCRFFLNLSVLSKIVVDTGLTIFRINLNFYKKTSVAKFDVYFFKQLTVTISGDVPHQIISALSSFVIFRPFLHINFVHDVDKTWWPLDNNKPQTLRLPIKHSLNFCLLQVPLGYKEAK